jgi:hypothetical protein
VNIKTMASVAVAGWLVAQSQVAAIDADFSEADLRRAVTIAVGSDGNRERFHAAYNVPVTDSTVEQVEVITEFRRFVLASEEQLALGNWMLARGGFDSSGQTLKNLLERWRGQVALRTRVRFHPQHAYTAIPAIDILVGEPSFLAVETVRTPVTVSFDGGTSGLVGAVVETTFNALSIANRTLPVRIALDGKELVRLSVDFGRLD